jgi:hypothetical protein
MSIAAGSQTERMPLLSHVAAPSYSRATPAPAMISSLRTRDAPSGGIPPMDTELEGDRGFQRVDNELDAIELDQVRPRLAKSVIAAIRANFVPGIVLQLFALTLVLGYFFVPSIQAFCAAVARYKEEQGYMYSAISTSLFGGVIPFVFMTGRQVLWNNIPIASRSLFLKQAVFYTFFFMYKGIEVDTFYRIQVRIFGDDSKISTILMKMAVDMFVYQPCYASPITTTVFMWKNNRFNLAKTYSQMGWEFITYRMPAILVTVWIVWIPAVCLIYSLPGALQIPLFNLVLCFYVLVLTIVANGR